MTDKTTLPSKAIIFSDPAYDLNLRDDVIITSQQEGLTVVEIIESKGPYDYCTLGKLIRRVMTCSDKSVIILIDEDCYIHQLIRYFGLYLVLCHLLT
ncbi:hypothetical protein [Candidatus Tisiphia endosymbiont of Piscicola geometra]|uniref:hypothetical protein n=1 Tax=Candidatus Tisiphia endosymbiont of Piscicola geometra TaxID=3066273 RepID=UPI00312CAA7E